MRIAPKSPPTGHVLRSKISCGRGALINSFREQTQSAVLAFRLKGRHLRFAVPLGEISDQMRHSRWRQLLLAIKAKLAAIDVGILAWDEAFLSDTILPNRKTVAEVMLPQIDAAYKTGEMPPLLGYQPGGHDDSAP
jgi:hypothetical protein